MTANSNGTDPEKGGSPRVGLGTFFLIVGMAVLFFMLAQAMVSHRFFEGGRYHRNGAIGQ